MNNIKELIISNSTIVENALRELIPTKSDNELIDSMAYSLYAGGKRLRPFITLEVYKAFSSSNDIEKAVPFACALEMIQTYSLIHDDLPCMDNDDYRRGKLTNHKVYGEAKALLAGDTLLTQAFEVIASNHKVSDKSIRLAITCLASCAGAFGMAGGQMIDLDSNINIKSYEQLKIMHALKTGALIKCAALLGYYAYTDNPDKSTEDLLSSYGENLGIAFQIRDDVLDVISSSANLGKPVGSDDKNGKITSLSFLTLEQANKEVEMHTENALMSIRSCLGEQAITLVDLAKYLIEREK